MIGREIQLLQILHVRETLDQGATSHHCLSHGFPLRVVVDPALHGSVGLDAPGEVACRPEQRRVQVLHGPQEALRHRRPDEALLRGNKSYTELI